jgi:hypothetical protein
MRKAPLSTPSMPFTALQPPSDRTKIPHYGLIEDTEVTHDNAREKSAKRQTPFVLRGASVTIISLIVPYLLGTLLALHCASSFSPGSWSRSLCCKVAHTDAPRFLHRRCALGSIHLPRRQADRYRYFPSAKLDLCDSTRSCQHISPSCLLRPRNSLYSIAMAANTNNTYASGRL